MAVGRPYVTGHIRLELDGQDAGMLRSVEGGDPFAEVVEEPAVSSGAVIGKHLGVVRTADIVIECSMTPSPRVASWIDATLGRSFPVHDGAIVEFDLDHKEKSRLTFSSAFLREIEFPALDAAGKQEAYLKLRLAPELARRRPGSGAPLSIRDDTSSKNAKSQSVSNFRLKVDGLAGSSVSRVEPLVVRQVLEESLGEHRPVSGPRLEIPDLVVTMHESADWFAWRDDFMINRNQTERNGTLEHLSQDLGAVLSRIELSGLGIHSLVMERTDARSEATRRVLSSMYCEKLSYVLPAAVSAGSTGEPITPQSRVEVIAPLTGRRSFERV